MVNRYLKVYISNDYDIFILRKYIDHLSCIFNITLTDLELHFQDFTRDENETIIDSYCGNRRDTNCVKSLKLVGESENTPEDDEILYHILRRQKAICELTLDIKPTPEFSFYGDRFRISAGLIAVRSEETIEGPDGLSHRIKYSIRRGDGTIGEFLVENNKYLYIKARGNTDISLSTFISKTKSMM
ncbi:hypothetical protein GCK72_012793 [Caenorhabditis remanei]|uniref:Uncharacterized protein n=1 Tax=Caenorhabditis remanei TaxID=31234 RepID=A0A6A5GLX8_CAERE|nr:hypothetical protein GCK72_012793 [Caenorhabditis remanei]KAF1756340.1 hypothetical protein GCK72_012793 [Caenorhabditis remanei]